MAHILTVVLSTSLALVIVVYALFCFVETGYIDVVTDKIQDLEPSLFEMLGTTPLSVHFVEFALRYGKRYGLSLLACAQSQYLRQECGVDQIKKLHNPSLYYGNEW
jgi:hypothetical protein